MGNPVSIIAKTPSEQGLDSETLAEALDFIKNHVPRSNDLTVVAVGENTSWTINEVSVDGNFIRLMVNHDAPAVHPDH
jgi:hypothetical protein